jgi:hypothetical protein
MLLYSLAILLYHLLLSCVLSSVNGKKLQHWKLVDNDSNFGNKRSYGSVVNSGEFIIEFAPNTTKNARGSIGKMIIGSGGTINRVYHNLFKGVALSNMSEYSILKILNHISIIQATRVSI